MAVAAPYVDEVLPARPAPTSEEFARRLALPAASPPASGRRRTARSCSWRPTPGRGPSKGAADASRPRPTAPGSGVADLRDLGHERGRGRRGRGAATRRGSGVIRLGSLAGYPFEGPRVLGGLDRRQPSRPSTPCSTGPTERERTPSSTSGTARTCRRRGSRSGTRRRRAGSSGPGAGTACTSRRTRSPAAARPPGADGRGAVSVYRPQCNDRQYDPTWREEWIGRLQRPTAGPLDDGAPATVAEVRPVRPLTELLGCSRRSRAAASGDVPRRVSRRAVGARSGAGSRRRRCPRPCRRAAAAPRRPRRRSG